MDVMTPTPDIDETLLTAFALGELDMDPDERDHVAAHVENDVDARRFVEEVRESAGLIVGALGMELVDGLTEIQHEMIERRLRELHSEPQLLRFRAAPLHAGTAGRSNAATLARAARFRAWLPTLASAAASVLIVAGTLAFFLRFNRHNDLATTNAAGSPAATPAAVQRPSTPPPVAVATNDQEQTDIETDVLATDDPAPVVGMVNPKSAPVAKSVKKPRVKSPTATAVATSGAKKSTAPAGAPGRVVAARSKTLRSPDAIEMKRTSFRSAMIPAKPGTPAKGPKTVNASPVRDGQALDKNVKGSPTKESSASAPPPKLFENPLHTAAEHPRSSFRVPPHDWSYKHIVASLVEENRLPRARSARIEELLNHFGYSYPAPADNLAVAVNIEVATCPWDVNRRLASIALKARDARPGEGDKPVASDLTSGVQFNAAATKAWRLIGYETGEAAPDGTFPAADLAPGRTVTALYEIVPVAGLNPSTSTPANLFTVSVRYRDTTGGQRETIKAVASDTGTGFDRASEDFRFASAVAAFGMLLRDSTFAGKANYADVIRWASEGKGPDELRQRAEFIELAKKARDLAR
jgi:hypothetical protein